MWLRSSTSSPSKEKEYWCDFSSAAAALVAGYASDQIFLNLVASLRVKYG